MQASGEDRAVRMRTCVMPQTPLSSRTCERRSGTHNHMIAVLWRKSRPGRKMNRFRSIRAPAWSGIVRRLPLPRVCAGYGRTADRNPLCEVSTMESGPRHRGRNQRNWNVSRWHGNNDPLYDGMGGYREGDISCQCRSNQRYYDGLGAHAISDGGALENRRDCNQNVRRGNVVSGCGAAIAGGAFFRVCSAKGSRCVPEVPKKLNWHAPRNDSSTHHANNNPAGTVVAEPHAQRAHRNNKRCRFVSRIFCDYSFPRETQLYLAASLIVSSSTYFRNVGGS